MPIPGREKIDSTMTAPDSVAPSAHPESVTAGMTAWRSTCRRRTPASLMPRILAEITKGCSSARSNSVRVLWP